MSKLEWFGDQILVTIVGAYFVSLTGILAFSAHVLYQYSHPIISGLFLIFSCTAIGRGICGFRLYSKTGQLLLT